MKRLIGAVAAATLLTVVVGCGGENDDTATDPAGPTSTPVDTAGNPTVGSYPDFQPQDYTFVLEQICFCPVAGPVEVVVEQGEVRSAVFARGGQGVEKGAEAPRYLRLTIDDVIEAANDTEADSVEVRWPEGQDWPTRVSVDRDELAMDDEVTYVVRDVQVS